MAGIDPLSLGVANEALLAAETAFIEAALDLGVSIEVLQAQLSAGDLLSATVLPAQNGHDVIEIFDRPVAAQLPPDVRPGETLLLQVTGFSGNRIVVRNLGTVDPENPPPTVRLEVAEPTAARPTPVQSAQTGKPAQNAPAPASQTQPRAIPASPVREMFVAASVRQAAAMPPPVQKVLQTVSAVAQRIVRTAGDVLKVARVPDTPFTRTAAAIAPQASARLPVVLQRLDAALPRESSDQRVATLRTLIAFTARMNPANEETLAAQISAYASHVVEGGEPKLLQLLQAHAAAPPPQPPAPSQTPALQTRAPEAVQAPPAAASPDSSVPQSQPPVHAASVPQHLVQARVAERAAAVEHDLKSIVLSLLRDPQTVRTPTLTQALNETLITLTGTQLNALVSNAQDPGALSFAIPLYFHEGGKPAYLRISRDAQSRGAALDADNFHVAFVLDTAHLGTVAIDVESTVRAVKVNVKTERQAAASRFADTFASLRGRLEDLRYRVTSITANALGAAKPAATDREGRRDVKGLDLRA